MKSASHVIFYFLQDCIFKFGKLGNIDFEFFALFLEVEYLGRNEVVGQVKVIQLSNIEGLDWLQLRF